MPALRPQRRYIHPYMCYWSLLCSNQPHPGFCSQGGLAKSDHHRKTDRPIGAAPLQREIELLAQRGRLHLERQVNTTAVSEVPASATASLGLTPREAEMLALIGEGRTNRQIGQALFITPKTASVHVSRILAKLGVAGRGEAAAIAHRLGLDKQ